MPTSIFYKLTVFYAWDIWVTVFVWELATMCAMAQFHCLKVSRRQHQCWKCWKEVNISNPSFYYFFGKSVVFCLIHSVSLRKYSINFAQAFNPYLNGDSLFHNNVHNSYHIIRNLYFRQYSPCIELYKIKIDPKKNGVSLEFKFKDSV